MSVAKTVTDPVQLHVWRSMYNCTLFLWLHRITGLAAQKSFKGMKTQLASLQLINRAAVRFRKHA